MANKQYIGARYVPLIDGEWDENKSYEPLTVVMYLTNSYTSKTFVPAGTLPTNTQYWALTGNYNAGIGALTERVNGIDEDITAINGAITNIDNVEIPALETNVEKRELKLADRKFIFVSDSYGNLGWNTNVINRLNLDGVVVNKNGAGFYGEAESYTFLEALQEYAATLTTEEKEAVTDIIVGGGANDYGESIANIGTAIDAFIFYCNTTFPNAKIGCACISWLARNNDVANYIKNVIPTYQKKFSSSAKTYYIPNAYLPMHNYANFESDGVHPNTNGTAAITDFMCNYLLSGDADYIVDNAPTVTSEYGTISGWQIRTIMDKSGIDFTAGVCNIAFTTPVAFNSYALHHVATISGGCLRGYIPQEGYVTDMGSACVTVPCLFNTATSRAYSGSVTLTFYAGNIDVTAYCMDLLEGANTPATVTGLNLAPFAFHIGLLNG